MLPRTIDNAMLWVGQLVSSHPRNVLIVCGVAIAGSAVGVSRLQVDYNFIEELKPHLEIRRSIEKAEAVMGGFVSVVYIFDTDREDGIRNLELVQLIDEFSQYAEQQPLVRKAQSVAEITKDLNQALHGDDPAWYRLPDDSDTLAQLLFLYQLSGGEEINDYINFDSSQTVVQLRVTVSDASEIRELLNDLSAFLATRSIDGIEVKTTGMGLLWTSIADYIAASQLHGYSAVFILIFIFIFITYRSFSISVYAMIANVAPILVILGFMGASGMKLDYIRLLLATIAIGIAVDDTIHLLHRYQLEFELVRDYRIALRRTLSNVGPALVTTTIILVVSFLTYLYSDIAVLASFGVLLSAAVFFALLADLFLLPAMILVFKPFGPERTAA
jgi:predicted RND superfamily exporter protein